MPFYDQSGLLALIRLSLGRGGSSHPHLLGILPDFNIGLFVGFYVVPSSVNYSERAMKVHPLWFRIW